MIQLGDYVEDTVTGLKGYAICRLEYLNGCVRFSIQPKEIHEGKVAEQHYCDEQQVRVLRALAWQDDTKLQKRADALYPQAATGGDRPSPPKMSVDKR